MMEKCPAQRIGHHVGLGLSNQISRLATANQATQATQANRMNQGNQLGVPQSCLLSESHFRQVHSFATRQSSTASWGQLRKSSHPDEQPTEQP